MIRTELLKDQVVVIAGACGRIGRSFVHAVLDNEGICIIADSNSKSTAEFFKETRTRYSPDRVGMCTMDINHPESIIAMQTTVKRTWGKIDAFVNTAYPKNNRWGTHFDRVEFPDACENFLLHLGGFFLAAQSMCNFFSKQGYGNIVQIASIQGVVAPKFDTYEGAFINNKQMSSPAEYSIIKAGIIHFSRYIAKYYKDQNIRCNTISPGGIIDGQPSTFLKNYKNHCTSKGMLNPEDVNGTLIFLLSDMSKYINGQNIIIDDGFTL